MAPWGGADGFNIGFLLRLNLSKSHRFCELNPGTLPQERGERFQWELLYFRISVYSGQKALSRNATSESRLKGEPSFAAQGPGALLGSLGHRASSTQMFLSLQMHSLKGYWEKLNSNLEYVKYSKPHRPYRRSVVQREWCSLILEEVCIFVLSFLLKNV